MSYERIIASAQAALVAAAGTTGALAGVGLRDGTPSRPFNVLASLALGDRAEGVWGFDARVTLPGVALEVVLVFVLGLLFALLAPSRGVRLLLAASAVSIGVYAVTRVAASALLRPALSIGLTSAQLAVVCVALALSLAVGTRLAR